MKDEMDKAKALYKPASDATAPQPDSDRRWRIMVAMWERMAQWFGNRWEREYGTIENQTIHAWMGALNRYDEQDIVAAMHDMTQWDSPHPPSFPEFRGMVAAHQARRQPNWTEDKDEAEQTRGKGVGGVLENLKKGATTEAAKAEIEKMLQIWRGELDIPKAESIRHLNLHRTRGW